MFYVATAGHGGGVTRKAAPHRQHLIGRQDQPVQHALNADEQMRIGECSAGGGGGGQAAKDALGNDVKSAEWLKTHQPGDHSLSQGLRVRRRCMSCHTLSGQLVHGGGAGDAIRLHQGCVPCTGSLACLPGCWCYLQGDPTYLIVTKEGKIEDFGLNAVCTHLGCVVPWVGVSTCLHG